jgi:hypothetical protein
MYIEISASERESFFMGLWVVKNERQAPQAPQFFLFFAQF